MNEKIEFLIIVLIFATPTFALDNKILEMAERIAQTPYDLLRYNCWDYATDLKIELIRLGYKPRIAFGIFNNRDSHAWLEINGEWIEATTGQLIGDRSLYKLGYYGMVKWNPFKLRYLQAVRT